MINAISSGIILGLSLIVAIGAQNAFVLRQGIRNENVFAVCITCALSDIILILIGVYAFNHVAARIPMIVPYMVIGGALYLFAYGVRSLVSAWRLNDSLVPSEYESEHVLMTISKCLALTWLNPHVYLDTVILLGSISISYGNDRHYFGLGACIASLIFFFSLGYFSKILRPFLSKPKSWKILEILIGLTMISLSIKLLFYEAIGLNDI